MKQEKLLLLTSFFSTFFIISNILANKIISIGFFEVTASIICYPITFLIANIMTNEFGKTITKKVLNITIIVQLLILIITSLVVLIPTNNLTDTSNAYNVLFTSNLRVVIGACIAFYISQKVNIYSFNKIKYKCNNYIFSIILSTFISLLVDVLIFISISFIGIINFSELLKLIRNIYLSELIISIISLLFIEIFIKNYTANN